MANGTYITISSEDVGTVIKGTAKSRSDGTDTVLDLNDVTTVTVYLRDPNGDVTSYTATAVNIDGGSDGIWSFTTSSAIFSDNAGIWKIQAKYDLASGTTFYSNIKTLIIGEVLS